MSTIDYFKSLGVRILTELPPLWKIKEGTTQPTGYVWVDNNKPIYIKNKEGKLIYNYEYEKALLIL